MKYADKFHQRPVPETTKQRRRFLIAASVLTVAVVAVIVGVLVTSQPKPFTPQVTGAPSLQIEQARYDYGDVHFGQPVQTVFHLRNVGDKPLNILNSPQVQVVKGCCPPKAQLTAQTIWPGQEATLTLNFSMHEGMGGDHEFRIPLETNDPAQPKQDLIVTSNWIA